MTTNTKANTDHAAMAERYLFDADLDGVPFDGSSFDQTVIALAQVKAIVGLGHAVLAVARELREGLGV